MLQINYNDIMQKIIEEKNISKEEVEARIKDKLNKFSDLISKDGAAHIVANELGVKVYDLSKKEFKIKDLIAGIRNISLNGKIIAMYDTREFKTEKRKGRIGSFLIGDETETIRVVIWDEKIIDELHGFNEGDVITLENCYVRENNGFKELHLGGESKISLRNGLDINVVKTSFFGIKKKINELNANDNAEINGIVVQVFEPKFYNACPECNRKLNLEIDKYRCEEHGLVKEKSNIIFNFYLDDGSDNIRVVAFRDVAEKFLGLKENEAIKLKNNEISFEHIRENIIGKQVKIIGRVNKNEAFERIEFIANEIIEMNAAEAAKELLESDV